MTPQRPSKKAKNCPPSPAAAMLLVAAEVLGEDASKDINLKDALATPKGRDGNPGMGQYVTYPAFSPSITEVQFIFYIL